MDIKSPCYYYKQEWVPGTAEKIGHFIESPTRPGYLQAWSTSGEICDGGEISPVAIVVDKATGDVKVVPAEQVSFATE